MTDLLGKLCLLLLLVFSPRVYATDWFVAEGGSGDGSQVSPFGLIQDGLDAAQSNDVIIVLSGTYSESLQTQRNGPILLRAQDAWDQGTC